MSFQFSPQNWDPFNGRRDCSVMWRRGRCAHEMNDPIGLDWIGLDSIWVWTTVQFCQIGSMWQSCYGSLILGNYTLIHSFIKYQSFTFIQLSTLFLFIYFVFLFLFRKPKSDMGGPNSLPLFFPFFLRKKEKRKKKLLFL